jgi:glutamate N-acetyltransferase/amino-acid N-acetyltransferase
MKTISGGIAAPRGFVANGVHCGIKRAKQDLALLLSEAPARACGVFTKNTVKAAPILVSQRHVKNPVCRGVVVNSGNANCCNGKEGMVAANLMAKTLAQRLAITPQQILVASTGVIGQPFPIKKITRAIPALVDGLNKNRSSSFAKAIMTTDTFPKEVAVRVQIGKAVVTIGGVAKGAGMICPDMATMLSFITTDAAIRKDVLKEALRKATEGSFNAISVDGATSTNDCVFVLANGLANNKPITRNGNDAYRVFAEALSYVARELAKKIVLDGEGATKFIHVVVKNARTVDDAKRIALAVANNMLVKTAAYGEDPNWGRIAAAAGASGAKVLPYKLDIFLDNQKVLGNGVACRQRLKNAFKRKHIKIVLNVKSGRKYADIFTCDLSKAYISLNAQYT